MGGAGGKSGGIGKTGSAFLGPASIAAGGDAKSAFLGPVGLLFGGGDEGGGGNGLPNNGMMTPEQLGRSQARQNTQAAIAQQTMNMTNQVNPYGSLTYSPTGGYTDENDQWIPQYTATTTLSPEQQALYNSRTTGQQNLFNLADAYLPNMQQAYGRYMSQGALPDTQNFTDSAYRALTARSNQDIGTRREAERANLANQGVAAGSDAYNRAFQPIDRMAIDASNQATIGSQQLADMFLNREILRREQDLKPLQAYAGLFGLGQGETMPQFMNTPQVNVPAADITSPTMATNKAQSDTAAADKAAGIQSSASTTSAVAGLAGAAAMAAAMF